MKQSLGHTSLSHAHTCQMFCINLNCYTLLRAEKMTNKRKPALCNPHSTAQHSTTHTHTHYVLHIARATELICASSFFALSPILLITQKALHIVWPRNIYTREKLCQTPNEICIHVSFVLQRISLNLYYGRLIGSHSTRGKNVFYTEFFLIFLLHFAHNILLFACLIFFCLRLLSVSLSVCEADLLNSLHK